MKEKLDLLLDRCKNSVSITFNRHKNYYEPVAEYVADYGNGKEHEEIDPEVWKEIQKRDNLVEIQFYPDTAGAFYMVRHYDYEKALDKCLEILNITVPTIT